MATSLVSHQAIMVTEVLTGLKVQPEGVYVDATFGRGGHTKAILSALGPNGRLLVMDRDPVAVEVAQALAEGDSRVSVRHSPFSKLYAFCQDRGVVGKVNGVLLDLGVSSPQLDTADRGFSFRLDGPLDMRMDPTAGVSATEWINQADEQDISEVLKMYGEERFHRRMAVAIVAARALRPIKTTLELANIVSKANPAWEKHKHPATRAFQAIRLFVNNELGELSQCLEQILSVLAPKGRLVVLSFHSLEDRIVKQFIQKHERGDEHPRGLPIPFKDLNQRLKRVGNKTKPSDAEVQDNPRARSAVLRIAERLVSASEGL
jgi:16S rRNA (cytosine1402-N4)-methyltransferase